MKDTDYSSSTLRRRLLPAVILSTAVLTLTGCNSFKDMEEFARNGVIVTPDFSRLADGKYTGGYTSGIVSAKVELAVSDARITGFEILEHRCGKGKPAEGVAERVLASQSLEVDVVAGATVSSKVILKAAEVALTGER